MVATFIAFVLVFSLTGFAVAQFGGRDERLAFAAMVVAYIATLILADPAFGGPTVGVVAADIFLLAVLGSIAIRGAAFWPIWATGFHAGALMVHGAASVLPHLRPIAYADTVFVWSYAVLISLAGGCLIERRELRR